ncbi:unnamed protein product [Rotaria sordida]|uniref:Uncharacterized protein n=1 Tax=Rotaria sordida TaxID=392033 RepID=A0A813WCK5_9BILA|nr:unnamed protein product [Rotaria sordida]
MDSFSRNIRTSSVASGNVPMHEPLSTFASSRSSSLSFSSWGIHYKTIHEPEVKGVWDGYQTQEEFMVMHLR